MKTRILFYLAMIVLAASTVTQAQQNWDHYKLRTLKQLLEQNASLISERETRGARTDLLITADFPSRVKVTYTGEKRMIPAKRKEFITYWADSRNASRDIVDLFEEELLFKEDSTEYWLPVQKQVIPFFAKELKKGDPVQLFLIMLGARTDDGVSDWVFLVNEFEK
jgi:hypothetical protein